MAAGLLNLIAALGGHNKVQGGPEQTVDPLTGEKVFTYNPYRAKGGFFSHYGTGRQSADALNARIGGEAFLGQEEGKRRISEKKLGHEQDKELKRLEAELASTLGKERAKQIMEEVRARGEEERKGISTKQRAAVLEKEGIPYDEQNAEVFSKALTDPKIRNALAQEMIREKVLTSPQVRESAVAGQVQENLAPGFMNAARSVITAPPDTVTRFRDPTAANPYGDPSYLMGRERTEEVVQKGGFPYTDPTTGEKSMMGGDTKITRGSKPFISPETKNRAANISMPGSTNNVLTAPQNRGTSQMTTPDDLAKLLEMLRQSGMLQTNR